MLRSTVLSVLRSRSGLSGRPVVPVVSRLPGEVRSYSYEGSPLYKAIPRPTEAVKSYDEWKWVERLIPPETVPPAPSSSSCDPSTEFPSGWKAPNPPKNCGYVVRRNKNHLVPVYTIIKDRGQKRETRVRHIEGDIWTFEKHLGKFLKGIYPGRVIMTYTQEVARFVGVRGDYTEEVKEWLMSRGF